MWTVSFLLVSRSAHYVLSFPPQAPPGVKRNLMRSYESWSPEQVSKGGSVLRASALFALAWFHAVLQERRNFIPQGWTKFYEFSFADLRVGFEIIDRLTSMMGNSEQQWRFVHVLFEKAIYGGRIDNVFDLRVLRSYLLNFFDPKVLAGSGPKKIPVNLPGTTAHRVS